MRIKNFTEANQVLATFVPPAHATSVYTLERMKILMDTLDNPQDSYKVIHIAGTSGKTSTAYYVAAFLNAAGKKTGLTVSPHIDEINERVQIGLIPLPEEQFCRYLSEFLDILDAQTIKPTYFEVLIAFAYWVFKRENIDYAVVEVGLGGLLDGTNVVNRRDKTCVITDLGLDHTEVLGKTLPEIASQKAGIIHPYNTVFMYEQSEEVMKVVREVCDQEQATLHEIWNPPTEELPQNLPLFQRRNWYLASTVYDYIKERDGSANLRDKQLWTTTDTYIPARMETLWDHGKTVIIDGSHNAQKIKTMATSLKKQFPGQTIAALASFSETSKNARLASALKELAKVSDYLIITTFQTQQDTPKQAVNPKKIAEYCQKMGYEKFEIITDPAEAWEVLQKRPESLHLVTGSFYLLNHIRPLIHNLHQY